MNHSRDRLHVRDGVAGPLQFWRRKRAVLGVRSSAGQKSMLSATRNREHMHTSGELPRGQRASRIRLNEVDRVMCFMQSMMSPIRVGRGAIPFLSEMPSRASWPNACALQSRFGVMHKRYLETVAAHNDSMASDDER